MKTLSISNLNLKRGSQLILRDLNLDIEENEILGLVGNSGCGKTSLLYAIAGLLPIESGKILWQETDMLFVPPHKRNYGLVFQDHLLFPHKTVKQNLSFGLKIAKWEKNAIEKRVGELLELLGLRGFENRSIQSLSGGQAQRVSLGRALAPKPSLLMLDEPLAALDQTLRDALAKEIRDVVKQQKIPAIYVTHDLREVFFVADKLALMDIGSIHCVDEPTQMRNNPKDSYTANFFGLENQFQVKFNAGELICPWRKYSSVEYNLSTQHSGTRILILPEEIEFETQNMDPKLLIESKIVDSRFIGNGYMVEVIIANTDKSETKIKVTSKIDREIGSYQHIGINPKSFILLSD